MLARTLVFLWLVACLATASAAQSVDAPLLRAAYCIGVLKEAIRLSDSLATSVGADATTSAIRAGSIETSAQLRARHSRYYAYLGVRMNDIISRGHDATVRAVFAKGERDAAKGMSAEAYNAHSRCRDTYQSQEERLTCLAETEETAANVLRCQLAPDGLPF